MPQQGQQPFKRIAILHPALSGYSLACWRELKARHDVELLVFYWNPLAEAPFTFDDLGWIDHLHVRDGRSPQHIAQVLEAFSPEGICIPGWMDRGYLKVARQFKRQGVPVIGGLDGQWNGNVRQRAAVLSASRFLHPAIDVLWVAGERQAQFARRLGYTSDRCWHGLYCCDWQRFEPALVARPLSQQSEDGAFLYTGRYVPEKGIQELIQAYRLYRAQVPSPKELHCAGVGGMANLLKGQEGVVDLGFVQPADLPLLMRGKAALVLPSRREPWGMVLQEAATAGLPLICSAACGAGVHLLQDGYNGFLFETGNAPHLARCMSRMSELPTSERAAMGERSHEMSKQFTPRRWADTLVGGLRELRGSRAG